MVAAESPNIYPRTPFPNDIWNLGCRGGIQHITHMRCGTSHSHSHWADVVDAGFSLAQAAAPFLALLVRLATIRRAIHVCKKTRLHNIGHPLLY